MLERRTFMEISFWGGIALLRLPPVTTGAAAAPRGCNVQRDTPTRMYDGRRCWCHPRGGIVPEIGRGGAARVVLTMNTLDVSGSDVFKGVFPMNTDDLGKT